jgi:tetratricopeptide (TPR) repeat protein
MQHFARLLIAVVLLTSAGRAFAGDADEAKRHFVKGTKAYEIGAYDEAIKEYGEAYRLIDDPALLYNLGQAHRLAGHTTEALRAYRMFLLKLPDAPNRSEVESRIQDLESQLPAPATRPQAASPEAPPPTATTETPAPISAPDHAAYAAGRTKMIAGGVVLGAGVALLAGGIACGVLAQNEGNTITKAAMANQAFDYNAYSTGKTDQTVEIALLTIGGAAVVAGTVVMILGKRQQSRARASLDGPRFAVAR